MTEEDDDTCVFDRNTGEYPKDTVHLFAEIFYVHNDNILNVVVSANIPEFPAKECQKLISNLTDNCSKRQLMKSLTVPV